MKTAWTRLTDGVLLGLASACFLTYLPARLMKGRSATGAGLIGTLWGAAALRGLPESFYPQILVWLGACAVAVAVSDAAEERLERTDDPRIVIDEFAGYWTAVLFLPRSMGVLVLAFVLFRVFDVWKPGIIRRSGDLPGGWGIVVDDLLAGAAANLLVHGARLVYPI